MRVVLGFVVALDVAWVYLALCRGWFWRTSLRLDTDVGSGMDFPPPGAPGGGSEGWPSVAVVVPARNEAAVLARTLPRLLRQDYPGPARVVVVDDGSEDGTGALAAEAGAEPDAVLELTVVTGAERPQGWMGKVWALEQGRLAAGDPEFLLLTDADIDHPVDSLRRLVANAVHKRVDMVSLMAKLRAVTGWERLVVPAFVYFFATLYPFTWVNRDAARTAAAAGGCVLVRRETLVRAGAFASIQGAVIDDVALGQALKRSGARIWLGFADDVASVRAYDRLADLWNMVARSAFTELGNSAVLLASTMVGLLLLYVLPVAAVVTGLVTGDVLVAALGAGAWVVMALTYAPMLYYYGIWPGASVLLPFTAVLYAAMTVDSARRHWFGTGVAWKGRSYAPSAGR